MTKERIIFFLFMLSFTFVKGQQKTDTLFFGNKKIPLQRTKTFLHFRPDIYLPSEYKELESEVSFEYTQYSDSAYNITFDEEGNQITTIRWAKDSCKCVRRKPIYHLYSFVDTIKIKAKDFGTLRPYLKSKGKKIYFCSATIDVYLNDTILPVTHDPVTNGAIFSHWDDYYHYEPPTKIDYEPRKKPKYIVKNLYYRKGDATYFFDRTFVVVLY